MRAFTVACAGARQPRWSATGRHMVAVAGCLPLQPRQQQAHLTGQCCHLTITLTDCSRAVCVLASGGGAAAAAGGAGAGQ
jgi:hypothetical protein